MLNSARKLIGEAAHTLDLTDELIRKGHDVKLVLRDNCMLLDHALERDFPVALTLKNARGFHPVKSLVDFWELRRLIMEFRPDVVHCHRGLEHGLAAAVLRTIPRRQRPAILRTRHRVVPVKNTRSNRWLYGKNADAIIAVSTRAGESFGLMLPLLQDRMHVILSSVDTRRFSPKQRSAAWRETHGVKEGEALIGLIARLQRVKGQRPFLQAAARVAEKFPHAKFLVAGPGPDAARDKLRAFISELGLDDKVIFLSWVDDIHAATASLDVGVLASLGSEASSRIVYEYMASGVPVVATSVGCIPEVVGQPDVGFVVPPGDPDAMAEAICRLLSSEELREDYRRRGRARVEQRHTRERWIQDMINAYESAIQRKTGPPRRTVA